MAAKVAKDATVSELDNAFLADLDTSNVIRGVSAERVAKYLHAGPALPAGQKALAYSAADLPLAAQRRAAAGLYPLMVLMRMTPVEKDITVDELFTWLSAQSQPVADDPFELSVYFVAQPELLAFMNPLEPKPAIQARAGRRIFLFGPAKKGDLLVSILFSREPMPARKRD